MCLFFFFCLSALAAVTEREVVTPYSVFPMVLAAHAQNTTDAINEVMGIALAWHNTIIRGIRMQVCVCVCMCVCVCVCVFD